MNEKTKAVLESSRKFLHRMTILGCIVAGSIFIYAVTYDSESGNSSPPAPTGIRRTAQKPILDGRNTTGTTFRTISDGEELPALPEESTNSEGTSDAVGLPEPEMLPTETSAQLPLPEIPDAPVPESNPEQFGTDPGSVSSSIPATSSFSTTPSLPTTPTTPTTSDFPPVTQPLAAPNATAENGALPDGRVNPAYNDRGAVVPDVMVVDTSAAPQLRGLGGPPVENLLEIFNFDVDPDWVLARWENVSNVGPIYTRGYRVPLSTGPEPGDLVGSLTYYFDNKFEVIKITFEGYTGDVSRLIFSLRRFQMDRRVTDDPNVILYESPTLSDGHRSYMKTYHRLVPLDQNNPYKKYWVVMELFPPEY